MRTTRELFFKFSKVLSHIFLLFKGKRHQKKLFENCLGFQNVVF